MKFERHDFEAPGDALPRPHGNCYWLLPGRLLAGEHPGGIDRERREARLTGLLEAGMRCFVDLTGLDEGLPRYEPWLQEAATARGLAVRVERFPIADYSVPSPATMRAVVTAVGAALQAGSGVYLHCLGGIGRTGTAVGCLLVEQGFEPAEALALIERKWQVMDKRHRAPCSPETPEQREFVLGWRRSAPM